jgi:hypothetical protein
VNQASNELLSLFVDDRALPGHQLNRSQMLAAGTVLRDQAGPVLPIRRNLDTPLVCVSTNPHRFVGPDRLDRGGTFGDDARVTGIERNSEPVRPRAS